MSECVSPQKFLYVLILGYVKGHIDEVEYKPGEKLGSSEKWFERVIGHLDVPVKPLHIYYPDPTHAHDSLPDLDTCLGVILSGSPCDVTDIKKNGYTWAEPLIPFIRRAYLARIPMFGICFGHQIIAHSLGGMVGYLPKIPPRPSSENNKFHITLPEATSTPSSPTGDAILSSDGSTPSTPSDQPPVVKMPLRSTVFETGTRAIYCIPAASQCPVFGPTYHAAATNSDVTEDYISDEYALYDWFHAWKTGKTVVDKEDEEKMVEAEENRRSDVCFLAHTTHGQSVRAIPPPANAAAETIVTNIACKDGNARYLAKDTSTHATYPRLPIPDPHHPEVCPPGVDIVEKPTPLCPTSPVVLAYNCVDPHHGISYGNNVWSTQFHPEFPHIAMREYVRLQQPVIEYQEHVLGPFVKTIERVKETPLSAQVLVSFVKNVVKVVNEL